MDKILSNIVEIYNEILETKLIFEQTEKLHLFNGAFCKFGGGPQEHAKLKLPDWTGSRAWDIKGAEGTTVNAIDGGVVLDVQNKPYNKEKSEYGSSVTIKTDTDTHYYTHLSLVGPKIKRGEKIAQGEFVGKIGKPNEDPNWPTHVHIALQTGDIRSFIDSSCNLIKKTSSGKSSGGSDTGTTQVDTGNYYQKTGIGDLIAQQLKLEGKNKRNLNEVTLMAPVPLKPNFKGNFGEKRSYGRHPGTDIGIPSGTPVKAPLSGKVVNVQPNQHPCGGTIDIDYGNGFWSRFCHMKQINVKKDDVVERGEVVGLSGGGANDYGRGRSTGPHLHFTLKKDGQNVDPADYMEKFNTTDVVFDKSKTNNTNFSDKSDDEVDYRDARKSLYSQNAVFNNQTGNLYNRTGLGDLLTKPLGLQEIRINEEKVYGEFGKNQKSKYGSITLPKEKNPKIKSRVSGKIVRGNYNPSCSNQLAIEHDVDGENFVLEYCGISNLSVGRGQNVNRGTVLGVTDADVTISLFDSSGSRVYIDSYIKKELEKTEKPKKKESEKTQKLYDSPWGKVIGSILTAPFAMFQDKYDESGELKQKRWSSPTEKIQPDDWISQLSPTYPKKLKENIERIKRIL